MWPDPRIVHFVTENFLAARVHPRDTPEEFKTYSERYAAPWTPTILLLDPNGVERHRIEGFLPADDFLAQLMLGWGKIAFHAQDWATAEKRFRDVLQMFPDTDAAPEALYWAGVAAYKASGNPASLNQTAREFKRRYENTSWAKKASVWG